MNYKIGGMRCAGCAARIENHLRALSQDATVNFASHLARISDSVPESAVVAAVASLGYAAESIKANNLNSDFKERSSIVEVVIALTLSSPVIALGMLHQSSIVSGIIQACLSFLIILFPGRVFVIKSVRMGLRGHLGMDALISIGAIAAFLASSFALLQGKDEYYFDATASIILFVLIGKYIEHRVRITSLRAIDHLRSLGVKTASVLTSEKQIRSINVNELKAGDHILVKPGEKVSVDSVVVDGESLFDESAITGEGVPALKKRGDSIYAPSLNVGYQDTVMRAEVAFSQCLMSKASEIAEEAKFEKAKVQRLVDEISQYFVPLVLLAAISTLFVWTFVIGEPIASSLNFALAVLVIACPCALGLATPMALLVANGVAARNFILIRGISGFERIGKIHTLVLDKTGTLTSGSPIVQQAIFEPGVDRDLVLSAAASAEKSSIHPLGMALVRYAEKSGFQLSRADIFEEVPGSGVYAVINSKKFLVGSLDFMTSRNVLIPQAWSELAKGEKSSIFVSMDNLAVAAFVVDDEIRLSAYKAIEAIKKLGLKIVIATGDREGPAKRLANELGIKDVFFGLSPTGKLDLIKELQKSGDSIGMVGDGINDAPALASVDVGIAIGNAADVAIDAAAMVLPKGDLSKLSQAIVLSVKTGKVMRQNLIWAFFYNIVAIPIAALGLLSPMVASIAMVISSVSVVMNSLRIRNLEG